jgi:hypothetical protein
MNAETAQQRATHRLGVVAVQLVEAARYAWAEIGIALRHTFAEP